MTQQILVSAYFNTADTKRLPYFERLEGLLRPCGFNICLLNQSGKRLQTDLEQVALPGDLFAGGPCKGTLSGELLAASSVLAATRRLDDLDRASAGILRYARFLRRTLWQRRPCLCVLWNQFTGLHMAAVSICREFGIPWAFAHLGLLPGSIVFEHGGQMGESWVAREAEKFMALPVDAEDLARTARYLQYARRQKLNRKPQTAPGSAAEAVAPARRKGRKIVFYAGQNDYQSGMYPPWLPAARQHSPYYAHTLDALYDLARQAERFDWQILYKPHPNLTAKGHDSGVYDGPFADRVTMVPDANVFECIELADVTTTIVSQVSYLALIWDRPVVLLGRNQLSGKQCVYEPARRDEVSAGIQRAIQEGLPESMKQRWQQHVAQLIRYYLFRYDEEVEAYFPNDEIDAARYLMLRSHLPAPMHANPAGNRGAVVSRPHFLLARKLRGLVGKCIRPRSSTEKP